MGAVARFGTILAGGTRLTALDQASGQANAARKRRWAEVLIGKETNRGAGASECFTGMRLVAFQAVRKRREELGAPRVFRFEPCATGMNS